MEPEGLIPSSQDTTTGPCLEPDESSPHPHLLFLEDPLHILRLKLTFFKMFNQNIHSSYTSVTSGKIQQTNLSPGFTNGSKYLGSSD
jgi:hypothetical protein